MPIVVDIVHSKVYGNGPWRFHLDCPAPLTERHLPPKNAKHAALSTHGSSTSSHQSFPNSVASGGAAMAGVSMGGTEAETLTMPAIPEGDMERSRLVATSYRSSGKQMSGCWD